MERLAAGKTEYRLCPVGCAAGITVNGRRNHACHSVRPHLCTLTTYSSYCRGRFIAATADLSALVGWYDVRIKKLHKSSNYEGMVVWDMNKCDTPQEAKAPRILQLLVCRRCAKTMSV